MEDAATFDCQGGQLRVGGVLIAPDLVDAAKLSNRKSFNVALLGALSAHLDIPDASWQEAIRVVLPEKLHAANEQAFAEGRRVGAANKLKS